MQHLAQFLQLLFQNPDSISPLHLRTAGRVQERQDLDLGEQRIELFDFTNHASCISTGSGRIGLDTGRQVFRCFIALTPQQPPGVRRVSRGGPRQA
ncbi:hypothetical protein D3C84_813500 [compost metagenome]